MQQKTIFIAISDGSVNRNILQTDFLPELLSHPLMRIVLVCPERKVAYYRTQFEGSQVVVEGVPSTKMTFVEKVCDFLTYNAFSSETLTLMQWRAYEEGKSHIHPYVKAAIAFMFGRKWFRALMRWTDLTFLPVSPAVIRLFAAHRPSLVFSTMLLDRSIDMPLVRLAKRRGIKTVGMVRSWDNLTTYGFLRQIPERVLLQNVFLRDVAVEKHDVPANRISVIGIPHYDLHTHADVLIDREAFCLQAGLDSKKKILLYGALGDFLFPSEHTLVPLFERMLESGALPSSQLLFRPHPAHASKAETYRECRHVVLDKRVTYLKREDYGSWEMTREEYVYFVNLLHHSDAVITASGTSILVDAATFDKPLISIAFDGTDAVPYWFSVARFLDHATHSKALVACGGVAVCHSEAELLAAIVEALRNPGAGASGRANIVKKFVAPFDGMAGKRLANELLTELH